MDDKGSTLINVWGLPPMAHQDDTVRAVLCAFCLVRELSKIECKCSIGIAVGTVLIAFTLANHISIYIYIKSCL